MKRKIKYSILAAVLTFSLSSTYGAFPLKNQVIPVKAAKTDDKSLVEFANAAETIVSTAKITETKKDLSTTVKKSWFKRMLGMYGGGKSQVIALILCLVVGGLGIHRFYLGYIWQGVVQLLTFGGCGIWSLIDLIRIITGDLQPNGGRYSQTL